MTDRNNAHRSQHVKMLCAVIDVHRHRRFRAKLATDGLSYRQWVHRRIDEYVGAAERTKPRAASQPQSSPVPEQVS